MRACGFRLGVRPTRFRGIFLAPSRCGRFMVVPSEPTFVGGEPRSAKLSGTPGHEIDTRSLVPLREQQQHRCQEDLRAHPPPVKGRRRARIACRRDEDAGRFARHAPEVRCRLRFAPGRAVRRGRTAQRTASHPRRSTGHAAHRLAFRHHRPRGTFAGARVRARPRDAGEDAIRGRSLSRAATHALRAMGPAELRRMARARGDHRDADPRLRGTPQPARSVADRRRRHRAAACVRRRVLLARGPSNEAFLATPRGTIPTNWMALRRSWEIGHAIRFLLQLLALGLLVASALAHRKSGDTTAFSTTDGSPSRRRLDSHQTAPLRTDQPRSASASSSAATSPKVG